MTIGGNITKFRKKAGITSRQLAANVGVTPATISRYEHGKITVIPSDMIRKLSESLNVTVEQLIGDDPYYSYLADQKTTKNSSRKKEEKELLKGFYGLSPELQDAVRRICNTGLPK